MPSPATPHLAWTCLTRPSPASPRIASKCDSGTCTHSTHYAPHKPLPSPTLTRHALPRVAKPSCATIRLAPTGPDMPRHASPCNTCGCDIEVTKTAHRHHINPCLAKPRIASPCSASQRPAEHCHTEHCHTEHCRAIAHLAQPGHHMQRQYRNWQASITRCNHSLPSFALPLRA